MWFFFGFITLGVFCVSSLLLRKRRAWRGKKRHAVGGGEYELMLAVNKGSVRSAWIGVPCGEDFSFTLTPEGRFDRWSKTIGLTRECQTGDGKFDDAIYIRSDDPVLHRMLQIDPALRGEILIVVDRCARLFGRLKAIEVHHGRLWLVANPKETDSDEVAKASERLVPPLKDLAARLMRPQAERPATRDPFPLRAICMLAISTGLAINAGFAFFRIALPDFPFLLDGGAPFPWALLAGFGIVALLVIATLAWLGRSARTHLVLIELVLVGTVGAIISSYAELRDYNMDLDRAPPQMIRASVTKLYETFSKDKHGNLTRHCHLEMLGWPWTNALASREIDCGFYDRLAVGTPIDVEQHSGALGWPWVAAFHAR